MRGTPAMTRIADVHRLVATRPVGVQNERARTMDSADLLVSFAAPDRGVRIFRASPTEEKKSSGADGRTFGNLGN